MKKFGAILLTVVMLFACTDKQKLAEMEEQHNQLQVEYEKLVEESSLQENYIEEYTRTVNEVYDNLENIRKREGIISKHSKDIERPENVSIREKVMRNLDGIDKALKSSRQKLKALQGKNYASGKKIKSLEETVERLNQVLVEKENELSEMRLEAEQLSRRATDAENKLASQNQILNDQEAALNTAFYIIGTEQELKEKGIITEVGGILGLRKTKKLAAGFSKEELFTSTSIRETGIIPISEDLDDVKLLSPHNNDSFHLIGQDDNDTTNLEIIDPDEFWKMRYLVIMTKG